MTNKIYKWSDKITRSILPYTGWHIFLLELHPLFYSTNFLLVFYTCRKTKTWKKKKKWTKPAVGKKEQTKSKKKKKQTKKTNKKTTKTKQKKKKHTQKTNSQKSYTHTAQNRPQILGVSRACLQLVERMVQNWSLGFFSSYFFFSLFLHFMILEQHLKSYKWLCHV